MLTPTRRRNGEPSSESRPGRLIGDAKCRPHGTLGVVLVGRGTPNTPSTASPMNFSTTPPWASIAARAMAKYAPSIRSTSSGSAVSTAP